MYMLRVCLSIFCMFDITLSRKILMEHSYQNVHLVSVHTYSQLNIGSEVTPARPSLCANIWMLVQVQVCSRPDVWLLDCLSCYRFRCSGEMCRRTGSSTSTGSLLHRAYAFYSYTNSLNILQNTVHGTE